mmetsp:Transcript_52373/g.104070  ORF Transcript_52373/g.104070 Transcript_52373/m.104070 type:complete len:204 (-) Transcript_52373:113-724(-)
MSGGATAPAGLPATTTMPGRREDAACLRFLAAAASAAASATAAALRLAVAAPAAASCTTCWRRACAKALASSAACSMRISVIKSRWRSEKASCPPPRPRPRPRPRTVSEPCVARLETLTRSTPSLKREPSKVRMHASAAWALENVALASPLGTPVSSSRTSWTVQLAIVPSISRRTSTLASPTPEMYTHGWSVRAALRAAVPS